MGCQDFGGVFDDLKVLDRSKDHDDPDNFGPVQQHPGIQCFRVTGYNEYMGCDELSGVSEHFTVGKEVCSLELRKENSMMQKTKRMMDEVTSECASYAQLTTVFRSFDDGGSGSGDSDAVIKQKFEACKRGGWVAPARRNRRDSDDTPRTLAGMLAPENRVGAAFAQLLVKTLESVMNGGSSPKYWRDEKFWKDPIDEETAVLNCVIHLCNSVRCAKTLAKKEHKHVKKRLDFEGESEKCPQVCKDAAGEYRLVDDFMSSAETDGETLGNFWRKEDFSTTTDNGDQCVELRNCHEHFNGFLSNVIEVESGMNCDLDQDAYACIYFQYLCFKLGVPMTDACKEKIVKDYGEPGLLTIEHLRGVPGEQFKIAPPPFGGAGPSAIGGNAMQKAMKKAPAMKAAGMKKAATGGKKAVMKKLQKKKNK